MRRSNDMEEVEDEEESSIVCPVCGLTIRKHSDEEAEGCLEILNGWLEADKEKSSTETSRD